MVLHQNSYGRFRLETAGQVIELRQAENDPFLLFMIVGPNVGFRIDKRPFNSGNRLGS